MKKSKFLIGALAMSLLLNTAPVFTGTVSAGENNKGAWGDNGDGTYNNPLLPADYSDPDIIRVGNDYYLITSTFQLSPGLTILHSTDLVNWEIINAAVRDISQIAKRFNYDKMDGYSRGIWAPCLTYNEANKTFYIHFGTPDEGFFMVKTQDIYGEWSDVIELKRPDGSVFGKGWDDCGVLWDDDGQGYFIGTNFDGKYSREKSEEEISEGESTTYEAKPYQSWLYKISDDGFTLEDMGVPVHYSYDEYNPSEKAPEAYKIFKKDGVYYFYHNGVYGSDRRAWLMQSDNIYGTLEDGKAGTFDNPGKYKHCPFYIVEGYRGPCQGNVIDATVNGETKWYFWTHQGQTQVDGRPDSLIPIVWDEDGWAKADINATGVSGGAMPWENIQKPFPDSEIKRPATSDEFDSEKLGYQWVWNFQPDNTKWNLTEREGYMRMYAKKPLSSSSVAKAPNTLLQRMYKTDGNVVTTKIDISGMTDGQNAGLTHSAASANANIGVVQENGKRYINYTTSAGISMRDVEVPADIKEVYFKSEWDTDCVNHYSYSFDGVNYKYFGGKYQLYGIQYRGDYVGIYNYNNSGESGYIDVDYLRYEMDTPQANPIFMGVSDGAAYDQPVNIRWSKGNCTLNGEAVEYDELLYTPGKYTAVADDNGKRTEIEFTINEGVTKPEIKFPVRINVGGGACEGESGAWQADVAYTEGNYGYVGGSTYTYTNSCETMYKTDRISKTSYEYRYDLENNGKYKVTLYMMENYHSAEGKRVMDVSIEGNKVEESLDIFKAAGGKNIPLVKSYTADVQDNQLNVVLSSVTDQASLCGIEVEPVTEETQPSGKNSITDVTLKRSEKNILISGNFVKASDNDLSKCSIIAASYDADKQLAGLSIKDIDIPNETTPFSMTLESEFDNVSLYVWDSTKGMKNLTEAYSLSIQTEPTAPPANDILSVDFKDSSAVADWSNAGSGISYGTDSTVGNYAIIDGNAAASAPKTASFTSEGNVCVEFDMMIPTNKADGTTPNTIGGGMTGGLALMQGDKVAGVIGYRGNSSGTADHALSTGGSSSDYMNVLAGSKATAYRDQWLHYVINVNTTEKTGDIYIINPADGTVYKHEGRFDKYIANITSLTNIGIVSDQKYSIGLANLRVYNPQPNLVKLTVEDEMTVQYLPAEGSVSTVSYNAAAYRTISYNKGGEYVPTTTDILMENANIEYSVTDANGDPAQNISISNSGLLEIQYNATPGIYTVTASSGSLKDSMELEVREAGEAAKAQITGVEEIVLGADSTYEYKVLPIADTGSILPQKEVQWSIEGDAKGASIDANGILTPGTETGKITLNGTIKENNLSATLDVYIRSNDEIANAPVDINGMILYSKELAIANTAVTDIAVKSSAEIQNASVIVKAFDKYNLTTAYSKQNVGTIKDAACSVKLPEKVELGEAVGAYVMILDADGNVVSKKTVTTDKGIYKGIPLVGDWYTNEAVGIGTNASGGPPAGVDPAVTNTSSYSVKYEYDDNYPEIKTDNMLWYKTGAYNSRSNIYQQHSADWEEQALPIGNGYLGGMVFGMPSKDQIQFNEETMWLGGYRGMQEAQSQDKMNPYMGEGPNSYVNGGNLFIDFGLGSGKTVNNYYRDLNLNEGVQHVSYTYNGVNYNREYFASYPAQTIVMRYTADKAGSLSFDVKPVMAHPGEMETKNGEITIVGKIKDSEPYYGGGQVRKNIESDLEYCTKIKVVAEGGTVTDEYGSVNVANADAVTIYLTAATDYDPNQFEIGADGKVDLEAKQYKHKDGVAYAVKKAEERLANTNNKTYDELKSEHIADYKSLFDRVHFSLTDENEVCTTPTNELQAQYRAAVNATTDDDGLCRVSYDKATYDALNKHFEELYYNYGRYMMISSSREDNIPANLQGKWCQSVAELWGSGFTLNINLEMNYWFAGSSNLKESHLGLVGWTESQIPAGKVTAKNYFGIVPKSYKMDGGNVVFADSTAEEDDVFIMHTKGSIFGTTDPTGSTSIQSPGNTAWLMQNIWNVYETTGDKQLLSERLYPILRQSANFYTQYMYANKRTTTDTEKYPNGYYYTTGISRSPEQGPRQEGIYYDLQLVAGLLDYTIEAATVLDVDADKVAVWKEIRENIKKPVELGEDGQVKEWEQETTYNKDADGNAIGDPHHRHISHLVALYPGNLINRNTPDFLNGAKIVLNNRGDESTGWSCSFKMLMWGRLLDGNRALEIFRYQLAQKTYGNMFDYHAPFQIDGNFGSSAGVVELLMQSDKETINLLPALPQLWADGTITGLKTKNGAEVDITWADGKLTEAKITPIRSGELKISNDSDSAKNLKLTSANGTTIAAPENGVCTISVAEGVTYTVVPTDEAAQ